jgi:hypothetical protein
MSRTFSINSGSLESLKVSTRCGRSAKARQIQLTAVWLNPLRFAMARVLQCVASGGFVSSVHRTTCQRSPYGEPPGSGKLSHPGSPILSQVGSPMLSHPGAGIVSHPAGGDRTPWC